MESPLAPQANDVQRDGAAARWPAWMSRVDPKRSLILMTVGAVAGLGLAGIGLFTADGTVVAGVPKADVALVNGRHILLSDYVPQLQDVTGKAFEQTTREERQRTLDDMIREELLVQRGLELDFPATDPDTRAALVAAVEQQNAANVTTQSPSDATLRAFYDANPSAFLTEGQIAVNELVLPGAADPAAVAEAGQAAAALRSGGSPETVAAAYGMTRFNRVEGEAFYFAAKEQLGPALFAAVAKLPKGSVSDPLVASDGVHVFQVVSNVAPASQAFEDIRDQVLTAYKSAEQRKLEAASERYLRSKADIKIAKDFQ